MSSAVQSERAADLVTYAYSYPHKSSYHLLAPPVRIADAWRDDDVSRLSFYVHIAFCEMRCGFCNLFTQSRPQEEVVSAYLLTLERQMRIIREAVPRAMFQQFAIGGGTPTLLTAPQLAWLLGNVEATFGQTIHDLRTSVELSPSTTTPDRVKLLEQFGVQRVSLGVQSFDAKEARHIGRPQALENVYLALDHLRAHQFPILNIDLIYGHPDQTIESWRYSIREALRYRPEEIYLYPLYIRPQTGLAVVGNGPAVHRRDLYYAGRDLLAEHGYSQASLRCFRQPSSGTVTAYACQRDGMIGLGCGARSYTRRLHYASRFATTQAGIKAILGKWIAQSDEDLAVATHGMWLSEDEQLRRYVILSLLQAEGLSTGELWQQFPAADIERLTGVGELFERGWLRASDGRYVLTEQGMENSDAVGPLLYSDTVRDRLRQFIDMTTSLQDGFVS